ncbi:hypothetical protein ACFL5Z_03360 [Planctomycetota bacterium]
MKYSSTGLDIPVNIMRILSQNTDLEKKVLLLVKPVLKWIESGGHELPFFPEYTDHGIQHINQVLETVSTLITEESISLITPEDIAVLILAIVLHDCAMHLRPDGFLDMVRNDSDIPRITLLDDKNWHELWEIFFLKARRWDGKTVKSILGDVIETDSDVQNKDDLYETIQRPEKVGSPEKWNRRYCKFIGEFIREHHGRLAHEIALSGVPGPGTDKIKLLYISEDLLDLAGLVARSHSIKLRDTFEYLQAKYYGRVTCRNVHAIYLMVLLRVSDYLDIKATRAHEGTLRVRTLRSPLSKSEWNMHASIKEMRPDERDKEAIFVIAAPENARSFLKISNLLKDLQLELDVSWAVLGEVYSRQDELSKLGITLRRIRSNLENVHEFAEKSAFVPVNAAFRAADADLLKLLIDPLYGSRFTMGIRELVQNAVDAVHELRGYYNNTLGDYRKIQWSKISDGNTSADVEVSLCKKPYTDIIVPESWDYWIEVRDRGIGMNSDIICNYFLNAGASLRNSEFWRVNFLDMDRKAKVPISGRFGIGVLAAFLLGDTIKVLTRHVNLSEGISFVASIEDSFVELQKAECSFVGTRILVKTTSTIHQQLNESPQEWDWYCAKDPIVVRLIRAERTTALSQKWRCPSFGAKSTSGWRRMKRSHYSRLFWSHKEKGPKLACNGIIVEREWPTTRQFELKVDQSVSIKVPKLIVYDGDGHLPLNIERTRLQPDVIINDKELIKDIIYDFFRYLIEDAPTEVPGAVQALKHTEYNGFVRASKRFMGVLTSSVIATEKGTMYFHPWCITESHIHIIRFCFKEDHELRYDYFSTPTKGKCGVVYLEKRENTFCSDAIHGRLLEKDPCEILPLKGTRVIVHRKYLSNLSGTHPKTHSTSKVKMLDHNWSVYSRGDVPDVSDNDCKQWVRENMEIANMKIYIEGFVARYIGIERGLLIDMWKKTKLPVIVPYRRNDRLKGRKIFRRTKSRIGC